MVPPPSESSPLNIMSLSFVADLIMKSEDALLKLPNSVPPSFNLMSVPSASRMISPPASMVKSPVFDTLGIGHHYRSTINFFQLEI